MIRYLRLTNLARPVWIAWGEMYPERPIFERVRQTRSFADKRNFGSAGNGMVVRLRDRKRGADPPKNPSGRGAGRRKEDASSRCIRAGSGSRIAEANLCSCQLDDRRRSISRTRLRRSTIAESKLLLSGMGGKILFLTMIGKGGQISVSSARVRGPQTSLRSRKFGEAKTTVRHFRHTWINRCQDGCSRSTSSSPSKYNMSRRTSSGSMSIATQPAHIVSGSCKCT